MGLLTRREINKINRDIDTISPSMAYTLFYGMVKKIKGKNHYIVHDRINHWVYFWIENDINSCYKKMTLKDFYKKRSYYIKKGWKFLSDL